MQQFYQQLQTSSVIEHVLHYILTKNYSESKKYPSSKG